MKQNKKIKYLIISVSTLITLILIGLVFIGNYFFNYGLVRVDGSVSGNERKVASATTDESKKLIDNNRRLQKEKTSLWLSRVKKESISVNSKDNLKLVATKYQVNNEKKWAILVHGYSREQNYMNDVAQRYLEKGYNVITPDLRAHGLSEGRYLGMGWLDRKDMLLWINKILEYKNDAQIVLHGISMGGATVLMTSGEEMPDNVKAIVSDCAYTSAQDIFASELRLRFGLPAFPILNSGNVVAQIRAGYSIKEASALNQVKKSNIPTLFIHGSVDNFVPVGMVHELYSAETSEKDLLIIEGAGHAESRDLDPDQYYKKAFNFIENYI